VIISDLLTFWLDIFTTELQENSDDELKMTLLKRAPMQEDPVRKAPWLVISENDDTGKGFQVDPLREIGGGHWWIGHLRIKAAPKVQKTAERAYYLCDVLGQRIIYLLRQYSLGQPVRGNVMMENTDWFIIDNVSHKVTGGEGEWISYVTIEFHNRVSERGPFPFGTYPSELE
jgi:hypothetical protein